MPWLHLVVTKEISPGCSLEGLMLKLKLQYFGYFMWRGDSLEKTLMLGGIGGRRRRGWQRMRWLDGITDLMDMSLSELRSWWWTGRPGVLQFMGSQRIRHNWATELNDVDSIFMAYLTSVYPLWWNAYSFPWLFSYLDFLTVISKILYIFQIQVLRKVCYLQILTLSASL